MMTYKYGDGTETQPSTEIISNRGHCSALSVGNGAREDKTAEGLRTKGGGRRREGVYLHCGLTRALGNRRAVLTPLLLRRARGQTMSAISVSVPVLGSVTREDGGDRRPLLPQARGCEGSLQVQVSAALAAAGGGQEGPPAG